MTMLSRIVGIRFLDKSMPPGFGVSEMLKNWPSADETIPFPFSFVLFVSFVVVILI